MSRKERAMNTFTSYLNTIENLQHRAKMQEVLFWVCETFPSLTPKIAWNQPMFTTHGTFIIGFSAAKYHFAVAPERKTIEYFSQKIDLCGYDHTKELIRISWEQSVNFSLLENLIQFNIMDKAGYTAFWRK